MSKDKGSKNKKTPAADKSGGKSKHESAYKSEGKGGADKSGLNVFGPKPDGKPSTKSNEGKK
jgi:hypothetical protein